MISVPYMAKTSTEGIGLPLHVNTKLIIPDVHSEMSFFILSVRSSSLNSSKHECWVCDGCDMKQPLHSRFIFKYINENSDYDVSRLFYQICEIDPLSLCNFDLNISNFFQSFVYLRN